VEVIWDLNAS